jgi:hypothetical protein
MSHLRIILRRSERTAFLGSATTGLKALEITFRERSRAANVNWFLTPVSPSGTNAQSQARL